MILEITDIYGESYILENIVSFSVDSYNELSALDNNTCYHFIENVNSIYIKG